MSNDDSMKVHAIQNNWGVRDLKRAIESLLYERTGLSTDKHGERFIFFTPK